MPLPVGRVQQAGLNLLLGQLGEVGQNLRYRLAIAQPAQHIGHADARTRQAGPPKANFGVDENVRLVVHSEGIYYL